MPVCRNVSGMIHYNCCIVGYLKIGTCAKGDLGLECYDLPLPYLHAVRSVLEHMLGEGRNLDRQLGCRQSLGSTTATSKYVLLVAALASYGPIGIAQSQAKIYRVRKRQVAKVAISSSQSEDLQGQCFVAATLRAIGESEPTQCGGTEDSHYGVVEVQPSSISPDDYSSRRDTMAIYGINQRGQLGWNSGYGRIVDALEIKAVIRDAAGRRIWANCSKNNDEQCGQKCDIRLLFDRGLYSTLRAIRRRWPQHGSRQSKTSLRARR